MKERIDVKPNSKDGRKKRCDEPEEENVFPDIPAETIKNRENWKKESKQYTVSKENQDRVFTQEKGSANEGTDTEDVEPYLVAQRFCKRYQLRHFFSEEADNDIWLFRKNAGYDYIDEQKLGTLIYEMLPDELRRHTKNIISYLKNVMGFIYKEMAIHPLEASSNIGKCFKPKDFQQIKYHALFQNGVYDLESRELHPHFRAEYPYYLPIQAKYVKKPNKYLLEHTKNFQKLLWDTTDDDEETIEMIMAHLACLMIPYKSREIVFITGPTASGKSIFADLVDALMPPDRVSSMNITDFGGRFSLGNSSKYLLINGRDVEISSGGMISLKSRDISMLKQCSGDSVITTEAKGKMPCTTHILFKLMFASNGPVVPAHPDPAYEDRVTLLPFMRSVEKAERDPELGEKILAEKDCIITLCMRKLQNYINGEGNIILPLSEKSRLLKNDWFQHKNFIQEFLNDRINFTGNKEDFVKNKEVFAAYKKYYQICVKSTNDMRSAIAGQTAVIEEVLRAGRGQAEAYRKNNKRGISGIRLL